MAEKILSIYLAGSIRDGVPYDIAWREKVITELADLPVRIMNPLAGKTQIDGVWSCSGVPSSANFITKHDEWYVRQSDAVLFNFNALVEKYPNIGTLVEFGMAVALGKLIYVIIDPDYVGHVSTRMYNLHPFISEFAAQVFKDTADAIAFLKRHLLALSGRNSRYGSL